MLTLKQPGLTQTREIREQNCLPFTEGWLFIHDTDENWWSHPWRLLTHAGWRHCSMVIKHNVLDLHTLVSPEWGSTMIHPMIVENVEEDILDAIPHSHCLYFKVPMAPKPILRGPLSCVNQLKQILGLRHYEVFTPRGLFKLLINKYNAKEIHYAKK